MQTASILLFLALSAASSGAQDFVGEHLPGRARPPAAGQLPEGLAPYAVRAGGKADPAFDRLVDEALATLLELDPVRASELGFHQYDATMPAADSSAFAQRRTRLAELEARVRESDARSLDAVRLEDRKRLLQAIARARAWGEAPDDYLDAAFRAIRNLPFPPPDARAWNIIARVNSMAPFLRDGRAHLEGAGLSSNVLLAAVGRAKDLVAYLSNTLPVDMREVKDPVLREEFDHHLAQAAGGAADFHDWLAARGANAPDRLPVEFLGDPLRDVVQRGR
jgi:hypothetical protein